MAACDSLFDGICRPSTGDGSVVIVAIGVVVGAVVVLLIGCVVFWKEGWAVACDVGRLGDGGGKVGV